MALAASIQSQQPPEREPELQLHTPAGAWGAQHQPLEVSFEKPGSLGLKLVANAVTGCAEIARVNPGTQAVEHPELRAKLIVVAVGGESTEGKSYKEVLGLIKASSKVRPLRLSFVDVAAAQPEPELEPQTQRQPEQQAEPEPEPEAELELHPRSRSDRMGWRGAVGLSLAMKGADDNTSHQRCMAEDIDATAATGSVTEKKWQSEAQRQQWLLDAAIERARRDRTKRLWATAQAGGLAAIRESATKGCAIFGSS
jgi:hypothetical protein